MLTMTPSTEPTPDQEEQIKNQYGLFVHYGINTYLNLQWSDGSRPASAYAPAEIHVDQWVRTAYEAGMNYIIIVAKHHDGFCLWNTKTTAYGINTSSNSTDIVLEARRACDKYGIKLALYYSLWDCNCPFYHDDVKYIAYMMKQLAELLDGRYGKICELWFDGSWDKKKHQWGLDKIYDLIKKLQPHCQMGVNHTIGNHELKGGFTSKKFLPENYELMDPIAMFPSDFRLCDPFLPKEDDPKLYSYRGNVYYLPFEATICVREGFCWFYNDGYEENFKHFDKEKFIDAYRKLTCQGNLLVVNIPANKESALPSSDISYILSIADHLHIRRIWNE